MRSTRTRSIRARLDTDDDAGAAALLPVERAYPLSPVLTARVTAC